MGPIMDMTITRSGSFTAKGWSGISKQVWTKVARHWHKYLLKKHFKYSAEVEYHYQKRAGKYSKRKRHRLGHNRPLVYTGKLKSDAMRVRDIRVTGARSKRKAKARVILHVEKYYFMYRKDYNQPDKTQELQAISRKDEQILTRVCEKALKKEMKKVRGKGRRTGIKSRKK